MRIKNGLIHDLLIILIGLSIFLFGVYLVSIVLTNETASFIDVVPMCLSLWFIIKALKINELVGKETAVLFMVILTCSTLFSLLLGKEIVFASDGYFNNLEKTGIFNEHSWTYDNMSNIAGFSVAEIFSGAVKGLNLGHYEYLYTYCSLIFRYGGDIITHICIWRAFHFGLASLLMVLVAYKIGLEEKKRLVFILIICLIQPMMNTFSAYTRDAPGQAAIAIGLYILVSTRHSYLKNTIAFPIVAFLFYVFRLQYLIIAVFLYLWNLFSGKKHVGEIIFGVAITVIVIVYMASTVNYYDFLYHDLNVGIYTNEAKRSSFSIYYALIVGILGYFPWTNLLRDMNWPYSMYACFQGAMNFTVLYHVIVSNKGRFKELFSNPIFIAAILFFAFALFVPGHMSYTSVSMPLFAISIKDIELNKCLSFYLKTILMVFILGGAYNLMGLTGSGII